MSKDIQSALEKARQIAARLTGQMPDGGGFKRASDSGDENSSKKFANMNDVVGAQLAMLKAQQLGGNLSSEEYKVPDKLVGLVIGRGGDQLHRLQADTQCKVQIASDGPDAFGCPDRVFTIIGTKENIQRCIKTIEEILQRGANPGVNDSASSYNMLKSNIEMFEMKLAGNKCGLIIGKGGETIKGLSEQYGVKLVVVQETSAPSNADKPLRITGEPSKVAKAKEAVMALLNPPQDGYNNNNNNNNNGGGRDDRRDDRGRGDDRGGRYNDYGSNNNSNYNNNNNKYGGDRRDRNDRNGASNDQVFIKVPGDKAGIVIGKGGESVKEINRRSGAHVEIDKNHRNSVDGSDKMFCIKGTNEQIQFAQQLIYEKITGVQGSQPPTGYFQNPNDNNNNNSNSTAMTAAAVYGGSQQAWATQYGAQYGQQDPSKAAATAAASQDPNVAAAWSAYYSQYYGAAGQPGAVAATPTAAADTATATATTSAQPSINPTTGAADYSQAWVEYYRSLGMHEQAEAILRQQSATSATPTPTTTNATAPNGSTTNATNGNPNYGSTGNNNNNNSNKNGSGSGGYQQNYGNYN
jgi:far upstream element-binding protein